LQILNAPEKIISAILILKIIHSANKIQKEYNEQHENKEIDFFDYFSLELVKKRLNGYDVFKTPGL